MDIQTLTPDEEILWEYGLVVINKTIVFTWVVMLAMIVFSWLITRKLSTGPEISRWQNLLEMTIEYVRSQIREMVPRDPDAYLAFIATLFLFIGISNVLAVVPGFIPPTGSLSTTAALALCVFLAVPLYGIASRGVLGYLRRYIQPTVVMLPFNIIGELSRTLALAVRLFGNVMSAAKVAAIIVGVVPLLFPVALNLLGLLTGVIQAYIFAVLAMVYIASATRVQQQSQPNEEENT